MVNLELYRIFVLVAREKNITKASEILHISQPAVTMHIKNLENNLNIKLFNRTNGGRKENIWRNKGTYWNIKQYISKV